MPTDLKSQPSLLPESNRAMISVDEMTQDEIEKLARAIIHQAVQESKSCSIPVNQNSVQPITLVESDNNRKIIGRKNVVTHWIH